MEEKVSLIGVYSVEKNENVCLIELVVDESPSAIDIGEFTQESLRLPKDEWQVAYDEHYLNQNGDEVTGDYFELPEDDSRPTRLVFFIYFLDFEKPLTTPYGLLKLMQATEMPKRLKDIIQFEDVD